MSHEIGDERFARLLDLVRHLCCTLEDIEELSDPRAKTPFQNAQQIHMKCYAALKAVRISEVMK